MSRREWMRKNRAEVDGFIRAQDGCSNLGKLNDEERWEWVANVEQLYLWAMSDGVNV